MPQLNPKPWLTIFIITWLVLLFLMPNKVINYTFPNELTTINTQELKTTPWNWPWY